MNQQVPPSQAAHRLERVATEQIFISVNTSYESITCCDYETNFYKKDMTKTFCIISQN